MARTRSVAAVEVPEPEIKKRERSPITRAAAEYGRAMSVLAATRVQLVHLGARVRELTDKAAGLEKIAEAARVRLEESITPSAAVATKPRRKGLSAPAPVEEFVDHEEVE